MSMDLSLYYDPLVLKHIMSFVPTVEDWLFNQFVDGSEVEITEGSKVAADYKFDAYQIAPYITSTSQGKALSGNGYGTLMYDVPNVGVKKSLTKKDLEKRLFGEDPAKPLEMTDRAIRLLQTYLGEEKKAVYQRKILMVADLLQNHQLTINEYDEKLDGIVNTYNVDFLHPLDVTGSQMNARQKTYITEARNRTSFTTSNDWGTATIQQIVADCEAVIDRFAKVGMSINKVIITPALWQALSANANFTDVFAQNNLGAKNRYGDMEQVQLSINAFEAAHLNVRGIKLPLVVYQGTYVDNDGIRKSYLSSDTKAIFTADKTMKFKYGSHVIIPNDSDDFVNVTGEEIAELFIDRSNSTKELRLHSHPFLMPKDFASWSVATVRL